MEALMTLDCSNYSENIVEVLKIFQQIGWYIYNPQGKVEYLPSDDDDEYDWQCDTSQIILSITINRKTVKGKYTDMAWYLQNIIYKFLDIDVRLLSYKIEEYED